MSNLIKKHKKTGKNIQSSELCSLIRKQIVQPYLYSTVKPTQYYQEDPIQQLLKQTPIIKDYHNNYQPNRKNRFYYEQQLPNQSDYEKKRGYTDYRKIQYNMEVEEQPILRNYNDYYEDILRKSNNSSLQKIPFQYNSQNNNADNNGLMQIQYPNPTDKRMSDEEDLLVKLDKRSMSPLNFIIQQNSPRQDIERFQKNKYNQLTLKPNSIHHLRSNEHQYDHGSAVSASILQRQQKIKKLQQVGCNCRKSKCLKMYCECFHLQIFCNENCNCVGCGNMEQTHDHQQAIIEALTRNPKAFEQENPQNQGKFRLCVGLGQVKKGCRCKKTKCLKKYCQCYNTNNKCGKFCKCQGCQNC